MLKISVIIPSFNQGKFLEETILSILSQDYPLLELFIIDGGSTDNSAEIIKKYETKISGWVSEKDNGQSDAINKGFKICSGDIVSWLGSDDLYTAGTLHKVNELFSSLPQSVGVIHGNSEIFNSEETIRIDKGYLDWTLERQMAGMTFPQPSSFIRRTALLKSGTLNTSLHYGMDYDLFSRLVMLCDFQYTDILFSRYRLHDESKSTKSIAKFIEEWIIIFNSIADGLKITRIISALEKNNLKTKRDDTIFHFFGELKSIRAFDQERLLYNFLVNVVRYDYASANFSRVSKIGRYLKSEFPDYLKLEPSIIKIIRRTYFLSPMVIQIARKIKRSLLKK